MANTAIDTDILGQILLLQSTIHVMQEEAAMARFACRGFSKIPAFESVGMFIRERLYADKEALGIGQEACQKLFERMTEKGLSQKEHETILRQFKTTHRIECLLIETAFNLFGFLLLRPAPKYNFRDIQPYIQNSVNLIALVIENEWHKKILVENKKNLEKVVVERTRDLVQTNQSLVEEIKERTRVEKALRESEEKYREFIEGTDDLVTRVDSSARFIFVNYRANTVFGLPPEECVGRSAFDFVHPEDREPTRQWFDEMVATKRTIGAVENRLVSLGGEIHHIQWSSNFRYDDEGNLEVVNNIGRDIGDRKRAEEEREALQAQLVRAQKMESVGRLAGGVAHDFNNMLGVILGHAEIALDQLDENQTLYADLKEIQKAAKRSADLTRQLLAFARKQTVAPVELQLNDTVAGMLKMLNRLIGEDIELEWKPGTDLWAVKMDPGQIDQILANLAVNARDAIDGVGKVTIRTANAVLDEAYCEGHAELTPGEYVSLSVTDNGCGMEPEVIKLVFEPFFTTKATGRGTGLGLATVYGIVKQNQGYIKVLSKPGEGSAFRIYLPRHVRKTAPAAQPVPAAIATRGRESVLLVEDEPAILHIGRKMLGKLGYHVIGAATPKEALRLAGEHTGGIDLLMTDVIMPGMNGHDLAKELLKQHPNLKRLFMSGYTADVIAPHGVLEKGVHFIQKPFSMHQLAAKVRQALG